MDELDDLDFLACADRLGLQRRAGDSTLVERARADAALHLLYLPLPSGSDPIVLALPPALEDLGHAIAGVANLTWSVGTVGGVSAAIDLLSQLGSDDHPAYVGAYLFTLATWLQRELPSAPHLERTWLETLLPTTPQRSNPAKQLATYFFAHIPLFWAAEPWLVHIAEDWRLRILRYAESAVLVAGLADMQREWSMARFPNFWPNATRVAQLCTTGTASDDRSKALQTLLQKRRFSAIKIETPGNTAYENALHLLYLGEWVALYLAVLYGVDPSDRVPLQILDLV